MSREDSDVSFDEPPPGPLRSVSELVRSASALFDEAEAEKAEKAAESTTPRLQPAGTPSRLPAKKSEGANASDDDGVLWKNKVPAADAADSDDVGSTPAVRARPLTPPVLAMSCKPCTSGSYCMAAASAPLP